MCSYESPWNEDAKIGIGSVSSSNTSRENEQNAFPNNLRFNDVNLTSMKKVQQIPEDL